jgi:hypothetical protein
MGPLNCLGHAVSRHRLAGVCFKEVTRYPEGRPSRTPMHGQPLPQFGVLHV